MPNDVDYVLALNTGLARVCIRFSTDGATVVEFMVQLEAFHKAEWKPVRRYDDYYGRPHLDFLDRWGREYNKVWLDIDRNEALTSAIQDFKANGEHYVEEFLKGDIDE